MPTWQFSTSLDEQRRQLLLTAPAFGVISEQIERDLTVLCGHPEDCGDDQKFRRAVYCLHIGHHLFDLFFNSQYGYRGEYYESPDRGIQANAALIQSIRYRLIDWTRRNPSCKLNSDEAEESIATPSAKLWLAECGKSVCEHCKGEWVPPSQQADAEILNGRWEKASSTNASWGRMAPHLTKIKVIGAFLNDRHKEYVADRKRRRESELHQSGWS